MWKHSHSWAAGVLTGIIVDQKAVYLIGIGIAIGILFMKLGAAIRAVRNRRWAIRP